MKNSTKRGVTENGNDDGKSVKRARATEKHRILRIVLITFLVLVLVVAVGAITAYFGFMRWADGVTLDENLLPTARALPTFYDADGNKIPFSDDRYIKDVPDAVRGAFVALEDRRFYSHKGYDIKAMARAAWVNLKSGGTVEGASTITQQLVKNTHLGAERTLSRKLKEIALAMKIEEKYTKNEILSMYLSVIYFGAGAYGIKAASRVYFGCTPDELTLSQAATLAGIVKNPSRYSPKNSVEEAEKRRNLVLDVMCREGYIRSDERDAAKREKSWSRRLRKTTATAPNSISRSSPTRSATRSESRNISWAIPGFQSIPPTTPRCKAYWSTTRFRRRTTLPQASTVPRRSSATRRVK